MIREVSSRDEREEERARQRRVAEELKASGALEGIFAQVDAGAPLTGSDGVLAGVVKAALERGLAAELTEHLGYDRGGDPDAAAFPNSRNGTSSKTVSTEVGDVDLDVPRDRAGTFTPMLVPKGAAPARWARCDDHQPVRRGDDGAGHPAPSGLYVGH